MEFDFEKFKRLTLCSANSYDLFFRDSNERTIFFNFLTKNHIGYTLYAATDAMMVYWSDRDSVVRGWSDISYHNTITIDDLKYPFDSQNILDFIESEDKT